MLRGFLFNRDLNQIKSKSLDGWCIRERYASQSQIGAVQIFARA